MEAARSWSIRRTRAASRTASAGASAGRAVSRGHSCRARESPAPSDAPPTTGNAPTSVGIRLRALLSTASGDRSNRSGSVAAAAVTATRSRSVDPLCAGSVPTVRRAAARVPGGASKRTPGRS
ncbi:hypothetical protein SCYAM73S_01313 [Streptomyces cyaneofuscatus]